MTSIEVVSNMVVTELPERTKTSQKTVLQNPPKNFNQTSFCKKLARVIVYHKF